MPLENPSDKEARRRPIISLEARRVLVFVGLGPVFGALAAWSVVAVISGGHVDVYGIPPAYLFSLIACAITRPIDGILDYFMPIWLRAPLIAVIGAVIPVGAFFLVTQGIKGPGLLVSLIMIVGAVATGMSSLLSHDYCAAE